MTSTVNSTLPEEYGASDVFVFPASFAQQRLWFLAQLMPQNPCYNVPVCLRLTGALNIAALEQSLNEIVRRHETLRTTFAMVDGQIMQVVAPRLALSVVHLSVPISEQQSAPQAKLHERLIAIARQPFDLSTGPLLRVTLLQLNDAEFILLLTLHHIVTDGWSIAILMTELRSIYSAFLKGQPSPLPDLLIQYADFTHWQRQSLSAETLELHLAYWRQQLAELTTLDLPIARFDLPATYQGKTQQVTLSSTLTQSLESLSQQAGVTLFTTLLAAFQILLYRYTGQEDIVVGSPIANRNLSEIEGLIGFFVNSLVLRTDLSGNPTFLELLQRVQETTLSAYAHQDLPFEKLVDALQPTRDLSRNPLFQVAFALQNAPIASLELPNLTLSEVNLDFGITRLDLEFHCFKYLDTLRVRVIYSVDRFDKNAIDRMLQNFQILLTGIVDNPNQSLAHLPILTSEEQEQLRGWNCPLLEITETCVHQRFEQQVMQNPDAIAAVFANQTITYAELNQRANQLAHYLQQLGVQSETLIGVCVDRSLDWVVAVLAIWKSGAAYVPLDPDYPDDRLNFMLQDSQIAFLITKGAFRCRCLHPLQIIDLNQRQVFSQLPSTNPSTPTRPNTLAYVIYTSGTTGKPKGVLIEHRGLSNLATAQQQFNLHSASRVLQFASLSFDASIFECVMALVNGAALYLASRETLLPGVPLLQFLQNNAITHVTLPPAVLAVLPNQGLPALETVISAGEACSSAIVDRWSKNHAFFNAYGPTEATIWTTVAQLYPGCHTPTIGRPIVNTQIYLLDAHLQPVPIGITGEIYIGGVGVARGYFDRPELTHKHFIPNPFTHPSETQSNRQPLTANRFLLRLYKTGDLARYESDGNLTFLGRRDNQVKIRGFRVELSEIEAVLSQHAQVQATVVKLREDNPGAKRLVAYVVSAHQKVAAADLQEFLRSRLPNYLIPSAFVFLNALPLTANGKIDSDALPLPTSDCPIAPRTAIEAALAEIWSELLHVPQVGIQDNFFALGGDSLLTVRLMERVQQRFQQKLPLSALFQDPTIAGLAAALKTDCRPHQTALNSPLVPLQPTGSNPPFFCVHPIFGVVFPYCQLARHLGSDQPFYGLQPPRFAEKQPPHTRIEDMAADYVRAVQTVQPQGPYLLGGWSFGGLVAFEMAQQLQRSGQQVALVALLDTLAPVAQNRPTLWNSLRFLINVAVRSSLPLVLDYLTFLTTASSRDRSNGWQFLRSTQGVQNRILNELNLLSMLQIFYANSQAAHRYVPQRYPQSLTLLRTQKPTGATSTDDITLGWNELAMTELAVHQVPGNHFSMLRKPHVEVLANQLRDRIRNALAIQ